MRFRLLRERKGRAAGCATIGISCGNSSHISRFPEGGCTRLGGSQPSLRDTERVELGELPRSEWNLTEPVPSGVINLPGECFINHGIASARQIRSVSAESSGSFPLKRDAGDSRRTMQITAAEWAKTAERRRSPLRESLSVKKLSAELFPPDSRWRPITARPEFLRHRNEKCTPRADSSQPDASSVSNPEEKKRSRSELTHKHNSVKSAPRRAKLLRPRPPPRLYGTTCNSLTNSTIRHWA